MTCSPVMNAGVIVLECIRRPSTITVASWSE